MVRRCIANSMEHIKTLLLLFQAANILSAEASSMCWSVSVRLACDYIKESMLNTTSDLNFERIFFKRYVRSSKPATNKINRLPERQPIISKSDVKDSQWNFSR